MTDLYAVLGVRRNASLKTISAAYRQRFKSAHPDTGGSVEAFTLLKLARDVLMDPVRRKAYDTTGKYEDTAPDNDLPAALGLISSLLDQVVGDLVNRQMLPLRSDLVEMVRKKLMGQLHDGESNCKLVARGVSIWTAAAGRFKAKAGTTNHLQALALAKARDLSEQLEKMEKHTAIVNNAIQLLADGYKFEVEPGGQKQPVMPGPQIRMWM